MWKLSCFFVKWHGYAASFIVGGTLRLLWPTHSSNDNSNSSSSESVVAQISFFKGDTLNT